MEEYNPLENLDRETQEQIQELQILEQNFQQLLIQKQAFQIELNETDFALKEIEKAKGDIFKIVAGQVVIKSSKEELDSELKHKKELIELRLKNIDKQEKEFSGRIESVRDRIMKKISGKKQDKK